MAAGAQHPSLYL